MNLKLRKFALMVLAFPAFYKLKFFSRININDFLLDKFVHTIHSQKESSVILDVGSGSQKYKNFLEKQFYYESCDIDGMFMSEYSESQTYICSVESLVMPDNTYNACFCMMVLEHVSDPQKAINELARVTKTDGLIFISTNFMYPRHGKPQDYFRFTEEGLRSLAYRANLNVESIVPMGGYFSMQSQFLYEVPQYIKNWILLGDSYPNREMNFKFTRLPIIALMIGPLWIINLTFQVFAFVMQSLDFLDRTHRYTMGYIMTLRK